MVKHFCVTGSCIPAKHLRNFLCTGTYGRTDSAPETSKSTAFLQSAIWTGASDCGYCGNYLYDSEYFHRSGGTKYDLAVSVCFI